MARSVFSRHQTEKPIGESQTAVVEPEPKTAKDILQCGVKSVSQDESVYAAIGILADDHIGGLPVVNGSELVGLISEKDVLRVLYDPQARGLLCGIVHD